MEYTFLHHEKIDGDDTIFLYIDNILPEELLVKTKYWLERKTYKDGYCIDGKEIPRKQIWFHKDNKYFCKEWKYRYKRWESEEYDELLEELETFLKRTLRKITNTIHDIDIPDINSCLVNKYRNGKDSIKPHSDSVLSFGEYPTITNLSFGDTREFIIKRKKKKDRITIELKDNSMLIMAGGSQKYFTHQIPKSDSESIRYSMTFRQHLD